MKGGGGGITRLYFQLVLKKVKDIFQGIFSLERVVQVPSPKIVLKNLLRTYEKLPCKENQRLARSFDTNIQTDPVTLL